MSVSPCPHCGTELEIHPSFVGNNVRCSHCNGQFVAATTELIDDGGHSTFVAVLAGIAALHVGVFLMLALWQGLGLAVFLALIVIAFELFVWKRKAIFKIVDVTISSMSASRREVFVEPVLEVRQLDRLNIGARSPHPMERSCDLVPATEGDDDLVEVIPPRRPQSATPIPPPRDVRLQPRPKATPAPSAQAESAMQSPMERQAGCVFYGPETEIDLGRGVVRGPLVYVSEAACHGEFDSSLIDTTLAVARQGTSVRESLPYWPSYYHCTPAQRSLYLDWLGEGKSDPKVELGYVFIYFYGLERRVLVDQTDHLTVAREMIRLLPIYGYSNSFRRYASGLLWLSLLLASQSDLIPDDLLAEAIEVTPRWDDELVEKYLAILFNAQRPLPAEAAFHVCQNDGRSASSVIVRRHNEEFRSLFGSRYRAKFGDGIMLRASKREKRVSYQPASASLMRGYGTSGYFEVPKMPDVLAISSQFKELVEIWNESIDHLKAFSRAAQRAGGALTAEAYEALPSELREGDHPEIDAWMEAWENYVDEEHRPLVPVSALAAIKEFPERERLTKAQCLKILQSADAMGLAIEPDARMTGTNYRSDERVMLFFQENDTSDTAKFMAASALLRLGAMIAEADGAIDEVELHFITNHLEGQFNLSAFDSKRLECLQYLLLHSQAGDNKVGKTLAKRLSREHRLVVGEFLVGIAAADEIITSDELKALRKTYKLLELDDKDLDDLIAKHEASQTTSAVHPANVDDGLRLDHGEISRILSETRAVAGILEEAMSEVDEDEDIPDTSGPLPAVLEPSVAIAEPVDQSNCRAAFDIDPRYRPFLSAVLDRDEWDLGELRALADAHNMMLAGAIEAINEWSMDRFGDWMIEEGDAFQIRLDLLEETN